MILSFLLLLFFIRGSFHSSEEFRLIQDLKENYDTIERPVIDHHQPISVKLRVLLQQIVDVDERNQVLTLIVWNELTWHDYKLEWNPNEYGNITDVQIPKKNLWKPDVLLFNSVQDNFDATFPVNCVVNSTGHVFLSPPGIVKISCQMSMTWFPFDEQICFLRYGSWTYPGSQLNLTINDEDLDENNQMDMKYYVANDEFEIVGTPANRTVKPFVGDSYIELFFLLHIRRRSLYYIVNWVIPGVLISTSNILQFMMPTAGGEKVTLQTTNVLAVLIFLTQTSKATPPTSDSIPVLASFFSASLCIMGASTMATVLIMNVHFRSPALREMGPWIRYVFLETLPRFLFMPHDIRETFTEQGSIHSSEKVSLKQSTMQMNSIQAITMALRPRLSCSLEDLAIYSRLEAAVEEILEVLHVFEEKLDSDRSDRKAAEDWKFMAYVLDRFCLFLYFGLVAVTATTLILFVK